MAITKVKAGQVTSKLNATGSTVRGLDDKLAEFVSVKDFGADPSASAAVNTAAFTACLASGATHIYIPAGNYQINSKITIPPAVSVFGAGRLATVVTITANVVGFELSQYSSLRGIKLTKTGAHTNNGVDCGSPSNGGGRMIVEDVWVDGVGLNGICVRNGNLGTIKDVVCTNNGQDGINFTTETADNNAWKLEGVIDLRGNARDGLHFAAGSSVSDANAPRTNSCDLVVAQQNGRYGVYLGTRNNNVVVYAELNTTRDIFIDTFAYGSHVVVVEAANFTDNSTGSVVSFHSADANYIRAFKGKVYLNGGVGKGFRLNNDDGTAGSLDVEKTDVRAYRFFESSSNANAVTTFDHFNSAHKHSLVATGGFATSTALVAIATATPTTVATFGVTSADAFCGIIHVRDLAGTRVGATAIVSNFVDGGAQVLLLSSVQNSGIAGSALTVSGGNVQFAHTVGSTRNFLITLTAFGTGKSV